MSPWGPGWGRVHPETGLPAPRILMTMKYLLNDRQISVMSLAQK